MVDVEMVAKVFGGLVQEFVIPAGRYNYMDSGGIDFRADMQRHDIVEIMLSINHQSQRIKKHREPVPEKRTSR